MLTPKTWVGEDNDKMRGLVKEAVLFLEWWTLLGDPVERYMFKWTTSGYYEVRYQDNGSFTTQTIYRTKLLKYPDLLKWFDNLAPSNVSLEIQFATGALDDQDYNDFRRKYNILEDLGSAGYKVGYRTQVNGANWLFAASGQNPPFIVPQIATGGWPEFLGMSADASGDKKQQLIELFRLAKAVNITSFKVIDIDWNVADMVALARRFNNYEKGELSPTELAENAGALKRATGGDEFWDVPDFVLSEMEVYRDPTTYRYGLKEKKGKRALPAIYSSIESATENTFFATTNEGFHVLNSQGKQLSLVKGDWHRLKGNYIIRSTKRSDNDCNRFYYVLFDVMEFVNGKFIPSAKLYDIDRTFAIMVTNSNVTSEELVEIERATEKRNQECINSLHNYCMSLGAVDKDDFMNKIK